MVSIKICSSEYPKNKYMEMEKRFEKYSFELDHFQKYAIHGLVEQKNVLVTAHTGSGKTLPAEFAISYFTKLGKKVIYTSPIKSLSNQKYHEFSNQYEDIEFGILTGDIKYNPEADVLIMTTEILRNLLLNGTGDTKMRGIEFNLNIEKDVGCIIFDEVHYINDQSRGKVWEECFINIPNNVQLLMLSATIDKPEQFASWLMEIKQRDTWIAGTNKRVVPLTHHVYYTLNDKMIDKMKKEEIKTKIHTINEHILNLSTKDIKYNQRIIDEIKNIKSEMDKNDIRVSEKMVLNKIVKKLRNEEKLPAICFVFSRKKADLYAKYIELNLHDGDSDSSNTKKTSIVRNECKHIMMSISNYKEYEHMEEYTTMIKLLEKGIAVHHSGVIPVLREMIELLFSKGFIRLLFATETFSVGINMPTKTVLFTSLYKFDGVENRILLPHEYTQMAGRAGRRGLDKVGYVIHLNNLFDVPDHSEYKNMLSGKSQKFVSKFRVDYNLILRNMINTDCVNREELVKIIKKSMMFREIEKQMNVLKFDKYTIENGMDNMNINTNKEKINQVIEWRDIEYMLSNVKMNKKKRLKMVEKYNELKRKIMKNEKHEFEEVIQKYEDQINEDYNIENIQREINELEGYIESEISNILIFLSYFNYMTMKDDMVYITNKGICASMINEAHSLILTQIYEDGLFREMTTEDIIVIFSCFYNLKIKEDNKVYKYTGNNKIILGVLNKMEDIFMEYSRNELKMIKYINDEDYYYQYDMIECMERWVKVKTEKEAKRVLDECKLYDIYSGDIVKGILKINAIAEEMEVYCDKVNDIELKDKLHRVPELTLKYIATNQSLYV